MGKESPAMKPKQTISDKIQNMNTTNPSTTTATNTSTKQTVDNGNLPELSKKGSNQSTGKNSKKLQR
jgi:hypothetical protein